MSASILPGIVRWTGDRKWRSPISPEYLSDDRDQLSEYCTPAATIICGGGQIESAFPNRCTPLGSGISWLLRYIREISRRYIRGRSIQLLNSLNKKHNPHGSKLNQKRQGFCCLEYRRQPDALLPMIIFGLDVIVPQPHRSDFVKSMGALLEPTRVAPGCIGCRLLGDFEDRNSFILVEEWTSQAELDRHLASEASKILVAAMEMSAKSPIVRFDSVAKSAACSGVAMIDCCDWGTRGSKQRVIPSTKAMLIYFDSGEGCFHLGYSSEL